MEVLDFFDIDFNRINLIKELWEKNRLYHEKSSEFFSSDYNSICFEERMSKFSDFDDEMFKMTVCKDKNDIIGYCISTIVEGNGEVESIHVDESKRGTGIGKKLVGIHLQWMNKNDCINIGVTVSQENATTISFYKKLGFYPNTIHMQQLTR